MRLLDWCRTHLTHYSSTGRYVFADSESFWQYRGYPPVESVIARTAHPTHGRRHWTAGCFGTTGFLSIVLRTANIPVDQQPRCGHSIPRFLEIGYLSHGDDPYDAHVREEARFDADTLLIGQATFDAWFGTSVPQEQHCRNISRRPVQVAVEQATLPLLRLYCNDMARGVGHEAGLVLANLREHYTLAELEASGLWPRMDARLSTVGGCAGLPEEPRPIGP